MIKQIPFSTKQSTTSENILRNIYLKKNYDVKKLLLPSPISSQHYMFTTPHKIAKLNQF